MTYEKLTPRQPVLKIQLIPPKNTALTLFTAQILFYMLKKELLIDARDKKVMCRRSKQRMSGRICKRLINIKYKIHVI
jgi:hypothetical protein